MFGRTMVEIRKGALDNAENVWEQIQRPVKEVAALLRDHGGPFLLGETGKQP
jgi:hypothetical protein